MAYSAEEEIFIKFWNRLQRLKPVFLVSSYVLAILLYLCVIITVNVCSLPSLLCITMACVRMPEFRCTFILGTIHVTGTIQRHRALLLCM